MISSIFLHIHPARVSRHVLKPTYTLGLGLISAILFGVLTVTGLALMLYYVPYPPEAYRSMKDLQFVVTFGVDPAKHAPLVGPRHGVRGLPAHVPRVLDRLLQARRASSTGSSASCCSC